MKTFLPVPLLFLSLLPLVARADVASVPTEERVYIGMVVEEPADSRDGLRVRAVAPASPAYKAGIRVGDVVLGVGRVPVSQRSELRQMVRSAVHGERLDVELLREGRRFVLQVVLELRPVLAARRSQDSSMGADSHVRPVALPEALRRDIRRHRHHLREQLVAMPDGLDPRVVTDELQAIRDLARDAHSVRPGWMAGRAGEISVRFRDEEGSVVLYGANNLLTLELYDLEGRLLSRHKLNTPEERRSLPAPVLERLRRLR